MKVIAYSIAEICEKHKKTRARLKPGPSSIEEFNLLLGLDFDLLGLFLGHFGDAQGQNAVVEGSFCLV